LPKEIKEELKKHNIGIDNYYTIKEQGDLLYEIGKWSNNGAEKIVWLLTHGYTPRTLGRQRALIGLLRNHNLKNPSKVIEKFITLGTNLKNPDIAFDLMETMRNRFDDIKTLKALVNAGVNINATDSYNRTVLFSMGYKLSSKYRGGCVVKNNKDTIKEYIKLGADINHKDSSGSTILKEEKYDCNKKVLIELGAF